MHLLSFPHLPPPPPEKNIRPPFCHPGFPYQSTWKAGACAPVTLTYGFMRLPVTGKSSELTLRAYRSQKTWSQFPPKKLQPKNQWYQNHLVQYICLQNYAKTILLWSVLRNSSVFVLKYSRVLTWCWNYRTPMLILEKLFVDHSIFLNLQTPFSRPYRIPGNYSFSSSAILSFWTK